jgi:hypothetical protein
VAFCYHCGEEIEFINNGFGAIPIHRSGSCSGGYSGGRGYSSFRLTNDGEVFEFPFITYPTQQTLLRLGEAHYCGKQNEYSEITDGKQRLLSIFKYVFHHGNIPSSIIFLEEGLELSVIDDHHRLVAYFLNQKPEFRNSLPNGAHIFDSKLRK